MNPPVNPNILISRAANIVASQLDDEYLIMSVEMGSYIALRDVSARIWELLEQPHTMAALLLKLLTEYAVASEVCELEVSRFLEQMAESRLITFEPAV